MVSKISDLVKTVVADRKISKAEWENDLKPQLKDLKRATPETRELLEVWANDGFEAEDGVRADMRETLRGAGYDIASTAVPKPELVSELAASNMTETDTDFESLLAKLGNQNKTTIAVLDGGFQIDHPALSDKEWTNPGEIPDNGIDDEKDGLVDDVHGWDFAEGDKDVAGGDHGTHVSGTATRGTNRIQEIACRVFDPLDPQKVADAIDYAAKNGARVVNMSFKVNDEKEVALVKAAMERHPEVLFVKSAGNDGNHLEEGKTYGDWFGSGGMVYGAKSYLPMSGVQNMVVVAAADAKGERADYSNYAKEHVTVAIRGSEVFSSVPGSKYESMDGTSMASPNVTAVIAKCLTLAPSLTSADVKQILVDTTDPKDSWKELCSAGGLINQGRATRLAALIELTQVSKFKPEDAADKLGLTGDEKKTLLALAAKYPLPAFVAPPVPAPTPAPAPAPAPTPAPT